MSLPSGKPAASWAVYYSTGRRFAIEILAAGIEIEYDNEGNAVAPFKAGVDHLWVTENPNARFGDFETAGLDQFIKVKDSFRIDVASVTGTPMYYLMPHTRGFPSGDALRRAESRLAAKVRDRQAAFGHTWAEAMAFALRIEGRRAELETRWEPVDVR